MGKKRVAKKAGEAEEIIKDVPETLSQKPVKELREGKVYVYSSYNNTIMSLTDKQGNVLANVSSGAIGFKGTKKATPFAASKVADGIYQLAKNKGISRIEIVIKGIGSGRDSALRAMAGRDLEILSIRDMTPVPHNGPQPPKARRI
ncbi:MAG: 30S ribosomal protein S11 [Candidatus Wildermuthbacteria bacterium]|nr:30S ribosomal protein S11 [Candidatus Wildermuthbacteria bacterium]